MIFHTFLMIFMFLDEFHDFHAFRLPGTDFWNIELIHWGWAALAGRAAAKAFVGPGWGGVWWGGLGVVVRHWYVCNTVCIMFVWYTHHIIIWYIYIYIYIYVCMFISLIHDTRHWLLVLCTITISAIGLSQLICNLSQQTKNKNKNIYRHHMQHTHIGIWNHTTSYR